MKLKYVSPDIELLLLEKILTASPNEDLGGGDVDNETPGTGEDWS